MGWGDGGLATSLAAAQFPLVLAASAGNQELVELCTGKIGCWLITQPDRGSDVQVLYAEDWPTGVPGNKGNVTAKVTDGEIVLNGQCSAWVSNGAVAQVALGYIGADYGEGFYGEDGRPHGVAVIVPLDLPGVSRGKPLDKIGQRALPQGEIYFDNVRVPKRFAVALKDEYYGNMASAWSYAGTHMSQVFTGMARAAFELAAEVPMNHRLRHEDRMRRQREFVQLMAQRDDPRKFAERLRAFLVNWDQGRSPEYHKAWDQWMRRQADFYVAVHRMLTPEQRAAVERRLQNYADDFTRLAQRPAGAAPAAAQQHGCCGDMKSK